MSIKLFDRTILGLSGLAALAIGAMITLTPHAFYSLYAIDLGADPSLVNELRAPGANLFVLGGIIAAGAIWSRMTSLSAALGALVFLAYAFGRMVSVALDGMPNSGLLEAIVIEVVIGALCLVTLWRQRTTKRASSVTLLGLTV